MSEHEEYMPIYNDPMYWSYLNRDRDNKKTNTITTESNKTNNTPIETKYTKDSDKKKNS
jgi:hypothetical protein